MKCLNKTRGVSGIYKDSLYAKQMFLGSRATNGQSFANHFPAVNTQIKQTLSSAPQSSTTALCWDPLQLRVYEPLLQSMELLQARLRTSWLISLLSKSILVGSVAVYLQQRSSCVWAMKSLAVGYNHKHTVVLIIKKSSRFGLDSYLPRLANLVQCTPWLYVPRHVLFT